MQSGQHPVIFLFAGDGDGDGNGSMAAPGHADPNDPRKVFSFATNYHATQNVSHVRTNTSDVVCDEATALHHVAMDAAKAEYTAHLAETV